MILSNKAKEAIKTALAMTIAYGIALSMDWDKPMWAGFAVAFISLSTVGQSINKGALRMLGTLVAVPVALVLIALFAQERWLFISFVSLWLGFCTYKMGGTKYQYFWNVSGFVVVVVCLSAGPDAENAFNIAMLRAEETGLGILVYSLVSVLLWPSSSRADFEAITVKLASTQHQLFRHYYDLMIGKIDVADVHSLRSGALQQQMQFDQLLAAAQTDSYPVWEMRRQWRRYQALVSELANVLEHWRESFDELQALDLHALLPNLAVFNAELDQRFDQIERILDNQEPEFQATIIDLDVEEAALDKLPHFHIAAVAVTRSRAQRMESITRALLESISDIKGFARVDTEVTEGGEVQGAFQLDPERLLSALRVMLIFWLAWFTYIYAEGIPAGSLLVSMAAPFGMIMASTPQMHVSNLSVPITVGVLVAGIVYIFLMPLVSSFIGLGIVIFAVTFAYCYVYASPQQMLGRAFGLAMFVVITGISNDQSYSFLSMANTAMVFPLLFAILAITAYIPYSPLPEHVFLRLLVRFFKSAEHLVHAMGQDPKIPQTAWERWRRQFHRRELISLPAKLAMWAKLIDHRLFHAISAEQIQGLVIYLQSLSHRIQGLIDARALPQADALVAEHAQDMRQWRQAIEAQFQRWSAQPSADADQALGNRLQEKLFNLELRINESFERIGEEVLKREDYQNFYRLLGNFRGVSEALVGYAQSSSAINLAQWRESRF